MDEVGAVVICPVTVPIVDPVLVVVVEAGIDVDTAVDMVDVTVCPVDIEVALELVDGVDVCKEGYIKEKC